MLGAIGGVLALLLFFVHVGLTWNHGVAAGTLFSPHAQHGKYYLSAAGHHTLVSARMYWTVWTVEVGMYSGGGLLLLTFAIEGLVWLVGGESLWGRRRCSAPDDEGTKFNDNG